jgi:hypothetical protein
MVVMLAENPVREIMTQIRPTHPTYLPFRKFSKPIFLCTKNNPDRETNRLRREFLQLWLLTLDH